MNRLQIWKCIWTRYLTICIEAYYRISGIKDTAKSKRGVVWLNRAKLPAPQSLAIEKKKVKGSYREADVIERLAKDFNNKCYICELDKLQDP